MLPHILNKNCHIQNSDHSRQWLAVRGKGSMSRMFLMPRTVCRYRSKPIPNPPCGADPNFRRSKYLKNNSSVDNSETQNLPHLATDRDFVTCNYKIFKNSQILPNLKIAKIHKNSLIGRGLPMAITKYWRSVRFLLCYKIIKLPVIVTAI